MSPTVDTFCEAYGGKPFFSTTEEYEKFRIQFGDELRPGLEKNREARRQSEEAARKHCIA